MTTLIGMAQKNKGQGSERNIGTGELRECVTCRKGLGRTEGVCPRLDVDQQSELQQATFSYMYPANRKYLIGGFRNIPLPRVFSKFRYNYACRPETADLKRPPSGSMLFIPHKLLDSTITSPAKVGCQRRPHYFTNKQIYMWLTPLACSAIT